MLVTSGGSTEDIDRARRSSGGLGLFIRSLVGLDREAANEAFSEFLAGRTMTANQISFIDLIIAHLTHSGVMEPVRLYDSGSATSRWTRTRSSRPLTRIA